MKMAVQKNTVDFVQTQLDACFRFSLNRLGLKARLHQMRSSAKRWLATACGRLRHLLKIRPYFNSKFV